MVNDMKTKFNVETRAAMEAGMKQIKTESAEHFDMIQGILMYAMSVLLESNNPARLNFVIRTVSAVYRGKFDATLRGYINSWAKGIGWTKKEKGKVQTIDQKGKKAELREVPKCNWDAYVREKPSTEGRVQTVAQLEKYLQNIIDGGLAKNSPERLATVQYIVKQLETPDAVNEIAKIKADLK